MRIVGMDELSPAVARFHARISAGVALLAASEIAPIRRLIAVDQSAVADGLRITLVQAAIQEAGGKLLFRLETEPAGTPSPDAPQLRVLDCRVTDDEGRSYDLGTLPLSSAESAARLAFAPAPPEHAHAVTVVIERVEDWPPDALARNDGAPSAVREGPWVFRFSV
jgi:hypothetical protein